MKLLRPAKLPSVRSSFIVYLKPISNPQYSETGGVTSAEFPRIHQSPPPTVQDMTVSAFLESQIPRSNNSSFLSSLPSCRSLVLSFSSVDCITCLPLGPLCLDSLITQSMHKSKSVHTRTRTLTHTVCG